MSDNDGMNKLHALTDEGREHKRLNRIFREMDNLTNPDGDWEIQHGRADDLLLEVLQTITYTNNETATTIKHIIRAYKDVPKWYA